MPEHLVQAHGRTLCVLEEGDPEGRAVFALHGTPGSRLLWQGLIEDAEAKGIRLLGYDRPGYGRSSRDIGRNVAAAAVDIAAIADALGIDRFAVHGGSGGGPHALACAALLRDRVVGAASLAGVAPWDAEGLDWLDGMGQDNLDEFGAALAGIEELAVYLGIQRDEMLEDTPEQIASTLESLLCPPDRAVLTGDVASFLFGQIRAGIADELVGWVDDDLAFVRPWGFELDDIRVPVQVWHGTQDQFVPVAHGHWLAERIPGVETHIHDEDGHLTLQLARIGDVHAWLVQHF
jgi:pimeloyl-ACP methyl ester carboxylesterase